MHEGFCKSLREHAMEIINFAFVSVFISITSESVTSNGLQLIISSLFKMFTGSFKSDARSEHGDTLLKQWKMLSSTPLIFKVNQTV